MASPPCPFALSPSAGNSLGIWTLKVWVVLFRFPTPEKNYLTVRGFIKGRAPGKLTACEYDFAWLLYISKNFFYYKERSKTVLSYNSALFLMSLIECKTYFAMQFPLNYTRNEIPSFVKC